MRLMTIAARVISYAVGATYGNIEIRVITAFAAKRRLQIEILQSRSVYSTSLPWVVFSQAFTYKMYWYIRKLTCNINGSTNVTYIIFTLIYKYLLRRQQRLRSVVLSTSVCVCVCLSVCLSVRENTPRTTRAIFTNFFALVAYRRGSVLLRRGDEIPKRAILGFLSH